MSLEVSLLLDGQLPRDRTQEALAQTGADAGLRDRFTLYGLVGDALRGNATPDDGFTQRLLERMRREGVQRDDDFDPLSAA